MQNVEVTIGVCVKNSALTIRDAIQSIVNQDYPQGSLELIVADGYSQDGTTKIISEFLNKTDMRIKIFNENQGLAHARQIVVNNSNSKYIVWVDGDMILSESFIRKQVEFMEQNPKVGIAKGKYAESSKGSRESVVATLENVEFLLNTRFEGETHSMVLGTSGCIYRADAIKQVGGFDSNIVGVGEDMDAENRIRKAGWSLYVTSAQFYETRRQSWRSLWREYSWHGSGGRRLFRKNREVFKLYRMFPPVAIAVEFLRIPNAYKLTQKKVVLLLPFHYTFKRIAWFFGFFRRDLERKGN
jgi:glycosyltransferase involved in cell wall biosynthesis